MILMFMMVLSLPVQNKHSDCTVAGSHRYLLIAGDHNIYIMSLTGRNHVCHIRGKAVNVCGNKNT